MAQPGKCVLVAIESSSRQSKFIRQLRRANISTVAASSQDEAMAALRQWRYAVALVDHHAAELIAKISEQSPQIQLIVIGRASPSAIDPAACLPANPLARELVEVVKRLLQTDAL